MVCPRNWPYMGLFCHSSIRDFDVFSLCTFGSSFYLIRPSSHALLSHSSLFSFRYCPRDLFSALTHSSKLSRPFPPSLCGKYSLTTFDLGCSAWHMFSTFLVNLSILWSSESFQSTVPALYLITGTAYVFMAFTVFPELSFYFSIAFSLFMYSFLISLISWCFISSPSIIPKYLYPISSLSLMLFPSGSYTPSVLVTLPLDVDKCTFLYSKLHSDVT